MLALLTLFNRQEPKRFRICRQKHLTTCAGFEPTAWNELLVVELHWGVSHGMVSYLLHRKQTRYHCASRPVVFASGPLISYLTESILTRRDVLEVGSLKSE